MSLRASAPASPRACSGAMYAGVPTSVPGSVSRTSPPVATPKSTVRIHLCPDSKPEKGNTGISFSTKNAARTEKDYRKKGVKITTPTTKEEWGTYFMFADPDGNEFFVFEE